MRGPELAQTRFTYPRLVEPDIRTGVRHYWNPSNREYLISSYFMKKGTRCNLLEILDPDRERNDNPISSETGNNTWFGRL